MENKRFYHWLKLLVAINDGRLEGHQNSHLAQKLDKLSRRLHLNRAWRLVISTAVLTGWLVSTVQAQLFDIKTNFENGDGATTGFSLRGVNEEDLTGFAVTDGGDVNGDGIGDLLIAAQGADPNGLSRAGTVYVVFGREEGDAFPNTLDLATLSGTRGFKIFGENSADLLGLGGLSSLGDVNGDGVDDLFLAAYPIDMAYVIFGRGEGIAFPDTLRLTSLDGTNGFKISGEFMFSQLGFDGGSAGDVNDDGIADLIVSSPQTKPDGKASAGITYVIFGREAGVAFPDTLQVSSLGGSSGFKIFGENQSDRSGEAVSGVGDMNGDGVDDMVIGAAGGERSYVIFGREAGVAFPDTLRLTSLDGIIGFKIQGEEEGSKFGTSVSGAGDLNSDGIDDLVIGAPRFSGMSAEGRAYVIFGRPAGGSFPVTLKVRNLNGTNGFAVEGHSFDHQLGGRSGVSGTGDVNGDGIDDLLIGSAGFWTNSRALGYLIFGKPAGESFQPTFFANDITSDDGFHLLANTPVFGELEDMAFSGAGDINGDGINDLVVGAFKQGAGTAHVIFGREPIAPVVDTPLADATTQEGAAFEYIVPENTFSDVNPVDSQTLSASVVDGSAEGSALPDWLSFRSGRGTFSGTPAREDVGVIILRVTATDEDGLTVSDDFTLTVQGIPFLSNPLADSLALEGVAFEYTVPTATFTDPEGEALTLTALLADDSPLPDWLSFDGSTFSGTPASTDIDNLEIVVTATDPDGLSFSDTFELTIDDAPVVDNPLPNDLALVDAVFTYTVPANTFSDPEGEALTVTATQADDSALPDWLTFTPETGVLSGTPSSADLGEISIKVTATDVNELSVSSEFTLTVTDGAPVALNPLEDQVATQDKVFGFTIPEDSFVDPEDEALTFSTTLEDGSAFPAWLSFDAGTRTFAGTPAATDLDTLRITVTVVDEETLEVSDTFTLTVTDGVPIVGSSIADQEATEGEVFSFAIPAGTFIDPDNNELTLSATLADDRALPAWLTFAAATETFNGTPATTDIGTLAVKVTATDTDSKEVSGAFTLTILEVNVSPEVSAALADQEAIRDAPFAFIIPSGTFTDPDGDDLILSAALSDDSVLPTWLSFDGAIFSGTPSSEDVGTLEINVTATDPEGLSISDAFELTVNIEGTPIVATAIADQESTAGQAFSFTVPAGTFTDPDGDDDDLTLSAVLSDESALPTWLSFDGTTFSGTPSSEDVGTLVISVTATDPEGLHVSNSFELTIAAAVPTLSVDADISDISYYPNPVGDQLTVKGKSSIQAYLSDLQGRQVTQMQVGQEVTLEVSSLQSGIYILIVQEGSRIHKYKVVVE